MLVISKEEKVVSIFIKCRCLYVPLTYNGATIVTVSRRSMEQNESFVRLHVLF